MARAMTLILAILALGGCKKEEPPSFSVATYNAGLAVGFVPGAEDRAAGTSDAVAGLNVDLICLQEYWLPEHVDAVSTAASEFGHQYFPDPDAGQDTGNPACLDGEVDDLIACIDEDCADVCVDQLEDCVFGSCALDFLGLPKDCQGCVMANVGNDADEVQATCETQSTSWAYDASFGTGILSKLPLGDIEHHVFESTTNRRGVIHTTVESDIGTFDVYCTHLTAVFSALIPYPRESGSWEEEQSVQVDDLLDFIDETATNPVILLGDLNTGPYSGDVNLGEVEDHYERFIDDGFESAYVNETAECTICGANPLRDAGPSDNAIIDHVLLKDFAGSFKAKRVLDKEISATSCDETIDAAHSDHYGVTATLTTEE